MRESTGKTLCRVLTGAAVLLYLVALAIAVIGTQGLFGVQPDGLAAVWLIFAGLPWSLGIIPLVTMDLPDIIEQSLMALLPVVNILILVRLCRRKR